MNQKDFNDWQQKKAKELFSLSHKLMENAKQLSEHHAAELKVGMQHAMDFAKSAAKSDLHKLKELQESAAKEATARMNVYQKKVKSMLKEMSEDVADEAEKHLEKARTSLEDWLDQAGKKMPVGGDQLAKVVRDVSSAGAKVFKEGRRMVNDAVDAAEKGLTEMAKHSESAAKPKRTPVKRPAAKKAPARKVARKTTTRRTGR